MLDVPDRPRGLVRRDRERTGDAVGQHRRGDAPTRQLKEPAPIDVRRHPHHQPVVTGNAHTPPCSERPRAEGPASNRARTLSRASGGVHQRSQRGHMRLTTKSRCRGIPGKGGIAPISPRIRAAASMARCGPPTRYPAASASPAPVVSTTARPRARVLPLREPRAPRAELDHPGGVKPGHRGALGLGGEREVRAQRLQARREGRRRRRCSMSCAEARSTVTRRASRAASIAACAIGSRSRQ